MKVKLLILVCLLTSLIGYLEWGTDQSMFLFKSELQILQKLFSDPGSVLHPFILLPLIGQLMLIFSLFQKMPNKWLVLAGISCIGILLLFMFIIGFISLNFKIALSSLPFLICALVTQRAISRRNKTN